MSSWELPSRLNKGYEDYQNFCRELANSGKRQKMKGLGDILKEAERRKMTDCVAYLKYVGVKYSTI